MADITTRPYSKNYSGLINQSVIAVALTGLCVTWHEIMRRKRRGKVRGAGLGSVETWEFGYLYQGRSWAKNPSPPLPLRFPFSWIKQAIQIPEEKMNELRGVDATLYIRWLRGCFWFATLHTFTTFLVLFPVHVNFSDGIADPKSMVRASISALVVNSNGRKLLWIHICLLVYITLTWLGTLWWIIRGAFRLRGQKIQETIDRVASGPAVEKDSQYYAHPHPNWPFQDPPPVEDQKEGLRARTVMVSNIPPSLRTEAELKEYFQFYMTRKVDMPKIGLPATTQPGFFNRSFSFLFNRVRRLPAHLSHHESLVGESKDDPSKESTEAQKPEIERVVIARKMTELASLMERREDVLRRLETAHIKLAQKVLMAVTQTMEEKTYPPRKGLFSRKNPASEAEKGESGQTEEHMDELIQALAPYTEEFCLRRPTPLSAKSSKRKLKKSRVPSPPSSESEDDMATTRAYPPTVHAGGRRRRTTIWEALLNLPRSHLEPYQPLIRLSVLFRGKTVPAIDYYTAKLNLLSSLITENRSKAVTDYEAVSTAFVTFVDPRDARRACKYLAVHPNNPLTCMVTMAPSIEDLDWIRIMKSQFKAEFLKDWVVGIGVWAFTLFWLFPVSGLIGLVSLDRLSVFVPGLDDYLKRHSFQKELIQSFIPTFVVAMLAILIPLILLLIGKKAHTITTLSAMHDIIMMRYYKFLVVNVLVFFCVGIVFVQTFLLSFHAAQQPWAVITAVTDSYPAAGPFYVGWLIFTTAMHAALEIGLFGLPLLVYPATRRQVTPRKRSIGIRPRTFNFYYWLPNHLLVVHILLLFAILNPLVLPFGMIYFFVECGIIKNQLIHVYAKHYEGNGQHLLIRMIRYSLDGLMFAQAIFLAYMVVLKKSGNVAVAGVLIVITAASKIMLTRICRAQFEHDDIAEALIVCKTQTPHSREPSDAPDEVTETTQDKGGSRVLGTWGRPNWLSFSYSTIRPNYAQRRQPNPFGPKPSAPRFSRFGSASLDESRFREVTAPLTSTPEVVEQKRHSHEHISSPAEPSALPPAEQPVLPPAPERHISLPKPETYAVVVPHPPVMPWDDQSPIELPYDNPFYTRSIRDVLWLPRNPMGKLDLDDTIDLRRSITSEASTGELTAWLSQTVRCGSPVPLTDSPESQRRPELRVPFSTPTFSYTGAEEIELPPGIAKRLRSVENEDDIEEATERRLSIWSRKSSAQGSVSGGSLLIPRRPSFINGTLRSGFRSFSTGNQPTLSTSSFLYPPSDAASRISRTHSTSELGTRPDMHAQADFVRSAMSASHVESPEAGPSAPPQHVRTLTTREAVGLEVQAEEVQALEERLKAEAEEEEEAKGSKLWWVPSWMFRPQPK